MTKICCVVTVSLAPPPDCEAKRYERTAVRKQLERLVTTEAK